MVSTTLKPPLTFLSDEIYYLLGRHLIQNVDSKIDLNKAYNFLLHVSFHGFYKSEVTPNGRKDVQLMLENRCVENMFCRETVFLHSLNYFKIDYNFILHIAFCWLQNLLIYLVGG